MPDKFMYIPNDYTQNYPFCRLQLVFNRTINRLHSKKVVQTSVINSPMSPDYFRGPELAPGESVQTDEQIDAFIR